MLGGKSFCRAGGNKISKQPIFNYSVCQMLTCWKMYRLQIPLRELLIGLMSNCPSSRAQGQEVAAEVSRAETVDKQLKPNKCKQTLPNLRVSFKRQGTVLGEEPQFPGIKRCLPLLNLTGFFKLTLHRCRHCSARWFAK